MSFSILTRASACRVSRPARAVVALAAAGVFLGIVAPAHAVTLDPQSHHSMYSDMRDPKVACGGGGAHGLGYMQLTGFVREFGVSGANRLRFRFQKQRFVAGVWQTVATREQTSGSFMNDSRSFYFGPRTMKWSWDRNDVGRYARLRVVALMDRWNWATTGFSNVHYHVHNPRYWCLVR